ncbi:MAG TPA: DUF5132 domain-containing protein [Candidatus Methylomirabilis sp.]|nr:DUF5132 domain-containing protein [Candidatus Methylomirabilis sp.]
MAIQDMFKGNVAMGLAVGLAAAVLIPIVLPIVARAAKPIAKAVIKSGLIVYEKGRESFAEAGEIVEDMVAEAKSELEHEHMAKMAATEAATLPATSAPSPGA